MAQLRVDGSELVLELTRLEKFEAVHGSIRLPVSAITEVRAVSDPWPELRGIRAPGTGIPRVLAVGTRRGSFGKDFLDEAADYHRLIVTTGDAVGLAAQIEAARR